MKKNDVILISALLVLSTVVFAGVSLYSRRSTKQPQAAVYLDGKEQGRYSLDKDRVVEINLENGGYNILQIKGGKADITKASCPDKRCVSHRPVNRQGESLVCLPNRVIVEIVNGEGTEVDGSTK